MKKATLRRGENPVEQLRLWHRFHVRLMVAYGGTIFLTILAMGVAAYKLGVANELESLQQRLMAVVTSLSETIDIEAIKNIPVNNTSMTPVHAILLAQFGRIANADPDIDSIYVLRPTNEPTNLRFFADYAKQGEFGHPGEWYFAADVPGAAF